MSIDRGTVRKIAALARLEVEAGEEERFARELEAILSYVEQLQGLDLDGIEPTSSVVVGPPPALRPDEERPCYVREEALSQAPDREEDYFRVPRVV